ncbi:MAG: hemerythrin domain-containing protein [Devosia sp.]
MTPLALPADLKMSFRAQSRLCDDLETVADSMPARVDRQFCLAVAKQIVPVLREAHAVEKRFIVPLIAGRVLDGAELVNGLEAEQVEDECFADEVEYELLQLASGGPVIAPETTGYMLRGFFAGLRRHMRHVMALLVIARGADGPDDGGDRLPTRTGRSPG